MLLCRGLGIFNVTSEQKREIESYKQEKLRIEAKAKKIMDERKALMKEASKNWGTYRGLCGSWENRNSDAAKAVKDIGSVIEPRSPVFELQDRLDFHSVR